MGGGSAGASSLLDWARREPEEALWEWVPLLLLLRVRFERERRLEAVARPSEAVRREERELTGELVGEPAWVTERTEAAKERTGELGDVWRTRL